MSMRVLISVLALLAASPAFAAFSWTADNPPTGNASFTSTATGTLVNQFDTLSANTTPEMVIALSESVTLTSVTDSADLTWTIVAGDSDGTWKFWLVYANNASARAGNDYVTVNFSNGPSSVGYWCYIGELAGGPATASVITAAATGTSGSPSATLSSVTSGSAIIALTINTNSDDPSPGSGYTGSGTNNGTYGYGQEYNLDSASGSVTANFTGGTDWNIMAAAFAPAAGGSGAPSQPSPFAAGISASLWQPPVNVVRLEDLAH